MTAGTYSVWTLIAVLVVAFGVCVLVAFICEGHGYQRGRAAERRALARQHRTTPTRIVAGRRP